MIFDLIFSKTCSEDGDFPRIYPIALFLLLCIFLISWPCFINQYVTSNFSGCLILDKHFHVSTVVIYIFLNLGLIYLYDLIIVCTSKYNHTYWFSSNYILSHFFLLNTRTLRLFFLLENWLSFKTYFIMSHLD